MASLSTKRMKNSSESRRVFPGKASHEEGSIQKSRYFKPTTRNTESKTARVNVYAAPFIVALHNLGLVEPAACTATRRKKLEAGGERKEEQQTGAELIWLFDA